MNEDQIEDTRKLVEISKRRYRIEGNMLVSFEIEASSKEQALIEAEKYIDENARYFDVDLDEPELIKDEN